MIRVNNNPNRNNLKNPAPTTAPAPKLKPANPFNLESKTVMGQTFEAFLTSFRTYPWQVLYKNPEVRKAAATVAVGLLLRKTLF